MRRSRVQLLVAAPRAVCRFARISANAAERLRPQPSAPISQKGRFVDTPEGRRQNSASLLGGVPERSKGSDCKSDGSAFVGSNPTPSTTRSLSSRASGSDPYGRFAIVASTSLALRGGYSSVAEPQPSKLMARVRFPLPAPTSGCVSRGFHRLKCVLPRRNRSHSSVGRALPW
jgi:hypothetical protein